MTVALAWILLLAAGTSTSVELVDEVYRIPAADWRYIDVALKQRPARISARFDTDSQQVRLALMRREDVERLRSGIPHGVMSITPPGRSGVLNFRVREPGDYVVVVDNQSRDPASVRLRVWLDFATRRGPEVTRLSPERRLTVVLLSLAFFVGIVTFSARRLMHVIKR